MKYYTKYSIFLSIYSTNNRTSKNKKSHKWNNIFHMWKRKYKF